MSTSEPAPAGEPTPEEAVQKIYEYAAQELVAGKTPESVKANLVELGLDEAGANVVVDNLLEARRSAYRQAGKKNMLFGALWFIGGTVVTVATMAAAEGGGTYVVAWGAIAVGAIQFIHGLIQASSNS